MIPVWIALICFVLAFILGFALRSLCSMSKLKELEEENWQLKESQHVNKMFFGTDD